MLAPDDARGKVALPSHQRPRFGTYLARVLERADLTAWWRGELNSLCWSDVDREGGVIRLRPEHSKNGRGRTVAIEDELRALIERRWQARRIRAKDGSVSVADLVFHRCGRPVGDFRKAWAAACVAAGLYRVVGVNDAGTEKRIPTRLFHDLRRSRRPEHGPRRRTRARGHGDPHDGVRSRAAESEQCGRCRGETGESRRVSGERRHGRAASA